MNVRMEKVVDLFQHRESVTMKNIKPTTYRASLSMIVMLLTAGVAAAQCTTCATPATTYYAPQAAYYTPQVAYYAPQTAYSPVATQAVVYDDGWYLGKYLGRFTRRLFGVAPAPAYQVAYPTTYQAAYTPTYATSYAPATCCPSCSCSPCACSPCASCPTAQTTFRPVVMQAAGTCSSCSTGVAPAYYSEPTTTGPATSYTPSYSDQQSTTVTPAPSLPSTGPATGGVQPQPTFREKPEINGPSNLAPIPAEESQLDSQKTNYWQTPQRAAPQDRVTYRQVPPVQTAAYKPATSSPVVTWTSGR